MRINKPCPSRTRGTLEHFKTSRWGDIVKRCNGNNERHLIYRILRIKLKLSKDEFYSFCDFNRRKIMGFYSAGETPSINRIDPNGHYELGNIEIISLRENLSLTRKPNRKPIIAINNETGENIWLPGCWSKEAVAMGFDPSSIQKICKKTPGRGFSYKGYRFRYA